MTEDPPETEEPKPPTTPEEFYDVWKVDPRPENLHNVVRALDNTIDYKVFSMGAADNPQMRHQARIFAAEAVQKYDPAYGASLRTWTQNQLQSMHRFKRENQGPIKIPDRASIDNWALERASREYEDEHGMEPDVKQLADKSGLSVKRIAAVRRITRPVASSEQMFNEGEHEVDFLGEAMDYVYDESDPIDRRIIEMTTGYGGTQMLSKKDIADKLGVSPAQITRRSDRISAKIHSMENDIQSVHV